MPEVPDWARALGKLPSGLFIVTVGRGDDATGFLGSFIQQVGFDPPALTMAVRRDRTVRGVVQKTRAFNLSLLDETSRELMQHFARGFAPGDPAFDGVDTDLGTNGIPFLTLALAHLECKVTAEVDWSDHTLFCAHVVAGATHREGQPLVHVRKSGLSY